MFVTDMASIVIASIGTAYTGMASIGMAYTVVAYIGMVYTVMANGRHTDVERREEAARACRDPRERDARHMLLLRGMAITIYATTI